MSEQGRPTKYTPELALLICSRLAAGESIRTICEDEEMPNASTVHLWVLEDRDGFSKQYAKARAVQAEVMFDEILALSDASVSDIRGDDKSDGARVQSRKLQTDSRKWYLSKVLPKKFGDKMDLTSDGKALPAPIYGGTSIQRYNSNEESIPTHEEN